MKNLYLLLCLALVITTGCLTNLSAQPVKGTAEVIILHVNDMHARIDNMAKLAYLADSLRGKHDHVYLVAAGDNFTGNPVVDMVEDKGYPMIDLMNRCGFNLSTVGNHEFDLGQEKLNARVAQAEFPFISSNIDASAALLRQPEPYCLLKAGSWEIPFLGIIQLGEDGLPDSHPSRLEGLKFWDGIAKAKEYAWLKSNYGMLIGLTHLGVEGDEPLAKAMPEFDLIIGGHSHTTMTKPMMAGEVMIVQAGSGLRHVGKVTLSIAGGKITDRRFELISLSSIQGYDKEIESLIEKYNDNEELNKPVGVALAPIEGEHELGSMMTDAITRRLGIDFAFQNIGGIRISSLPAGEIKLKDIYRLDPFGNMVVIYKMNREEIASLICNSFNRGKQLDLEVSGMTYTVVTDQNGACREVTMSDMNGITLKPDHEYTVGINSYIAASYKFEHRDPGSTSYLTSAQALIEYLKEVGQVNYSGVKRIFVK